MRGLISMRRSIFLLTHLFPLSGRMIARLERAGFAFRNGDRSHAERRALYHRSNIQIARGRRLDRHPLLPQDWISIGELLRETEDDAGSGELPGLSLWSCRRTPLFLSQSEREHRRHGAARRRKRP